MRISKQLEELINKQIEREYTNSRLYQAMAQYLDYNGYYGAGALYKVHSVEENGHALEFMQYLQDKDLLPNIPATEAQPTEFASLKEIVDMTYEREVETSNNINNLTIQATNDKDHMSIEFLQKFMTEQTEEEASALYWVDRINSFGDTKVGLLLIDKEMGEKAK